MVKEGLGRRVGLYDWSHSEGGGLTQGGRELCVCLVRGSTGKRNSCKCGEEELAWLFGYKVWVTIVV